MPSNPTFFDAEVYTLLRDGAGFGEARAVEQWSLTMAGFPLATGDVDGDGALDFLISTRVLLGDGAGGFAGELAFELSNTVYDGITLADVDGDDVHEVVVVHREPGELAVEIFAHEGGQLVSVGRRCPQGEFASDVTAQDLDGDGRDDVVIDMQFDGNEALLSTE